MSTNNSNLPAEAPAKAGPPDPPTGGLSSGKEVGPAPRSFSEVGPAPASGHEVGFVVKAQDYLLYLEGLPSDKIDDIIVS